MYPFLNKFLIKRYHSLIIFLLFRQLNRIMADKYGKMLDDNRSSRGVEYRLNKKKLHPGGVIFSISILCGSAIF